MDKIKDLLEEMGRFADRHRMHGEGQSVREYVNRLRPLVEDLHSRLKLWEGRADQLRKDCDRLYADRNNWMKQALAEDERANATQPVTNCNGFKLREAAKATMKFIESAIVDGKVSVDALSTLQNTVSKALAEPPRNCDLYSHEQALQIWSTKKEKDVAACFDVWLYEKGGAK